ncbi:13979_t:CDS:1 [Acaulospora colombiana]|uniref:13979_t:CDS:1 n=1 Tax=Acaulospora colombiana TaxID=27376 RepID=A0ACA9MFR1_9GLOM|nr:13979_t:CDS:1 [Acaulospora colombiana]
MAGTVVGVVTIGFMGLLLSAQDGEAGNLMFDGASLCQCYSFFCVLLMDKLICSLTVLYGSAAAVYVYSAVPKLSNFANLTPFAANLPRFPPHLRQPTIEMASSHLICAVCLTGVLILQAARYWAEGEEDDGALDSRVDSSEGNWKRSPRPVEPSPEGARKTRTRASESPSTRRKSPVKRKKAGSISQAR